MIKDCFKQAQFAVAAYADFVSARPEKTDLMQAGMTEAQSAEFAAYWRVVEQYSDAPTGVSATLFQAASGGPRYLAVRAALEPVDCVFDLPPTPAGMQCQLRPQYRQLRAKLKTWLEQGVLSAGFTVAGHAQGGYLAAALAAEFAPVVSRAYLYYVPGNDDAIAQIVQALGVNGTLDVARISRFPH